MSSFEEDLRFFLAGGLCASLSHGIATPIDVVKTRIQSQPQRYESLNLPQATNQLFQEEGPSVFFTGLGPTVVGYGVEGAIKFGLYEGLKPIFVHDLAWLFQFFHRSIGGGGGGMTTVPFILASVVAGGAASLLLCPMEETRIKLVTDASFDAKGLLDGFPKLIQEEGLINTFSGVPAMLSKQVPYTAAKQVSFDMIASYLYHTALFSSTTGWMATMLTGEERTFLVSVTAALLASILACLASHPGDVILTETYQRTKNRRNFWHVCKDIYKGTTSSSSLSTTTTTTTTEVTTTEGSNFLKKKGGVIQQQEGQKGAGGTRAAAGSSRSRSGGWRSFTTGLNARLVHVGAIITVQLVVYDGVKQLLGLPATGST